MRLEVNGCDLRIKQMGPDFLLVEDPINHPAGLARIMLSVDESVERWSVLLPEGLSVGIERVCIAPVP